MSFGNLLRFLSGNGGAWPKGASRRASRGRARRLQIETLESRALLSVTTILDPALPPTPHQVESPSAAVMHLRNQPINQPVAQLVYYSWYGKGQVKMFYSGRLTWGGDVPWESETKATATGPSQLAWSLGGPSDPEDFVANSTPSLRTTFSLYPINGKYRVQTLQVEAISIGEGPALKFVSGTITIADNTSQINVDMPSTVTVGNTISNSTLTLYWEENVNGKGFKPDTVTPATIEQLFVTAAQPVNAKLDPPTVARVNYATKLAQGTASSNIMAIANKIDADAMSEEHFTYETSAYRQAVWTARKHGRF